MSEWRDSLNSFTKKFGAKKSKPEKDKPETTRRDPPSKADSDPQAAGPSKIVDDDEERRLSKEASANYAAQGEGLTDGAPKARGVPRQGHDLTSAVEAPRETLTQSTKMQTGDVEDVTANGAGAAATPVDLAMPAADAGSVIDGVSAYHAKLFAHQITRMAPGGSVERISQSLFDSCIDLQPHQVDAGLFALRSPLSKGAILADEVGLGKTIEAGLVLCQYWAERRRRLLVLCPASLRKQWQLELAGKFNLPSIVIDGKEFQNLRKQGHSNPWNQEAILIASYPYASNQAKTLEQIPWDLAVLDEAHRLRNPKAKTSENLRRALGPIRKLLLTATPLQNNLMELHTLATMIDERSFGDAASFRAIYGNREADLEDLSQRLKPMVQRTLRRDVKEYVNYTARLPITIEFEPPSNELELYEAVSDFLQRDDTYALPKAQKHLMLLLLRKILASSSPALARTLEKIRDRLQGKLEGRDQDSLEELLEDEILDDEETEELEGEGGEDAPFDPVACQAEITELSEFIRMAHSIGTDEKSRALLRGLEQGLATMEELGAKRKALVFTESKRTQRYLKDYLEANGYPGEIVLFNGTNTDPESKGIYERWLAKNKPLGRSTGSRLIDIRTALMEHFRDHGTIMIATEAAGEGVNLQFCSLVVNYDLPWNPQRVEQRIGRCHRYGQKHDVVVVNFLNVRNHADQRVLELLSDKFHLFKGVFGSSDEVLGTLQSGVDFEKQILQIIQRCRSPQDIEREFDALQKEMETSIQSRMADVRQKLLEHFDEEVHTRFRNFLADTQKHLDHVERLFWWTTKQVLDGAANFNDKEHEFVLRQSPVQQAPPGKYQLIDRTEGGRLQVDEEDILYRMSHPLGDYVLDSAKAATLGVARVRFDKSGHEGKISVLEALKGKTGWMAATKLTLTAFADEEFILLTGLDSAGESMEEEVLEKMWNVKAGNVEPCPTPGRDTVERLEDDVSAHVAATVHEAMSRNEDYFNEEQDRLERWSDDLIAGAQKDLEDADHRIKEYARLARQATNMPDKLEAMKKQRAEEAKLKTFQKRIWDAQDEIRVRRDQFIDELHTRLQQKTAVEPLFVIQWEVV